MSPQNKSGFDPMIIVIFLIVAAVATAGAYFQPGAWYDSIDKPAWTPPDAVFGPVWTVLYIMIAVAGWFVFRRGKDAALRGFWVIQLILNGLWSWLFFSQHETTLALINIVLMLLTIWAFVLRAWPRQRIATWLFVPYGIWVAYATSLNAGIVVMN